MKFLPKVFLTIFLFLVLLVGTVSATNHTPAPSVPATPNPSASPSVPASPAPPASTEVSVGCSVGQWCEDGEVTFAGKLAARSGHLLDGIIANYHWSYLEPPENLPTQPKDKNPFNAIWISIRDIVLRTLFLFILAGAFLLIVTRGQSITVRKFIPRFILVVILVFLSFSLIKFLYDITDGIQGMFLYRQGQTEPISSADLLNVAFNYKDFQGYRKIGPQFEESAFMSLLMVKLTAATYYIIFILLIIRKVILWFFIVVSPIFPLLLFFSPIRNTAKIWIGEFFRWLLYGPLFAIFLAGLVNLWQIYIPIKTPNLPCDKPVADRIYPTSINILLGGPCQKLNASGNTDIESFNNLNNTDSFVQYLVALLMLWMVIIMPFILLKIFLDYLNNFTPSDNGLFKYLVNNRPKPKIPPPPKPPPTFVPTPVLQKPPVSPAGAAGIARELSRSIDISRSLSHLKPEVRMNIEVQKAVSQILERSNLQIPTMRDIAKFETNFNSSEVGKLNEAINRLAGRSSLLSPQESEQFALLRNKLDSETQKGNPIAQTVLEATKDPKDAKLPEENKVQTVNVEDYEEVKKTWSENYRNLEVPSDFDGQPRERAAWIKDEIKKIPLAIELLTSPDPQKQAEGRNMVSTILPFLLLGGFSKTEVSTYLKAKLEAAKTVLSEIEKQDQDEDSKLYVESKAEEKPKTMTTEAKIPEDEGAKPPEIGIPIEQTPDPDKKV